MNNNKAIELEKKVKDPEALSSLKQAESINQPAISLPDSVPDFTESLEVGMEQGEIAEKAEKATEHRQTAQPVKGQTKTQPPLTKDQLKSKLLAEAPKEVAMRKEVTHELNKEMKVLNKQFNKMKNNVNNAFELNNIIAKMRELKTLFFQALYASYELLKIMWLKIVHKLN